MYYTSEQCKGCVSCVMSKYYFGSKHEISGKRGVFLFMRHHGMFHTLCHRTLEKVGKQNNNFLYLHYHLLFKIKIKF